MDLAAVSSQVSDNALCLIVALVLFAGATVIATLARAWVQAAACAGLAFLALAFLVA